MFSSIRHDKMRFRIDPTQVISGNHHVNLCAKYQSDWSTFVLGFDEELFLDHENAYWRRRRAAPASGRGGRKVRNGWGGEGVDHVLHCESSVLYVA